MVKPIKNKEVVRNIIEALKKENERNAIMFALGVYCGLRISDILNLRVKNVKKKWNIRIKQQKTGKYIEIVLNRELKKMIDDYTENMDDDYYLIKSRKGQNKAISETQAYRIMQEIACEFKLKNIGCHSTRKTFAYWLYMDNKKDIGLVQKALGHGSSATSLTYIDMDKEALNKAIKKIKY
ncbi:integrase [Clostridium botulinum]|uniref:Site-specific recombinase, phage integrase family n=1 Tax=Clostridium botulinum (strain Eklund 17B / Type B) TaxID=935198 RepID=B2THE4_CLOBB|nr:MULTISPECIES: tyrosine-type recombinase/integrase [Clostridium]ACD25073.1 site-specific recombinase, phage integrase family [Clostridium botulinum B str. Eklund 17B (NRP)]MBY6977421.1 tyrosine-type recombinase/integrase [Clostridium botulinum]MBY7001976.1 tyrosine-type recombinase/integrase [Clostridium botulinum]MCR1275577.1 tyrosine-type recombinase/integrase [Clostridium botulinum]MCS6131412.1 integrase [Clostridium botulinum]